MAAMVPEAGKGKGQVSDRYRASRPRSGKRKGVAGRFCGLTRSIGAACSVKGEQPWYANEVRGVWRGPC